MIKKLSNTVADKIDNKIRRSLNLSNNKEDIKLFE